MKPQTDVANIKQANFPKPKNMGARDWGTETLLALVPKMFSLKKLVIKKGSKGGVQFHHKKNECGYLVSGRLLIRHDNGDGVLQETVVNEGGVFHFPPGAVHQEEALDYCIVIEASTPFFNDRVRVESHYGLDSSEGLPSTSIEDVIEG